jgi:NAD(P)-dependent dehydrogenase (short-subunit alcohol dehydrogenase family)
MGKMIDLEGRAIIVGGAGGGGIGTAIAVMLAEAGASVIGVDNTELGRATATEAIAPFPGRHLVVDADLTDPASMDALLGRVEHEIGPVRGAVNIVGGMLPHLWAPLTDPDALDRVDEVMRLNLRPALVTSIAVARRIVAHGQGGSIVSTASAAGLVSMAYGAGYAAAKAALINFTRTMAVEWGRAGLRVNAVSPGTIRARKLGRARFDLEEDEAMRRRTRDVIPLGRRGEPADIAGAVLFLLSDLSSYVTGQVLGVDGGALARPPYDDGDNLSVFVTDPALRRRLKGESEAQ